MPGAARRGRPGHASPPSPFSLPVADVEVKGLLDAIQPPGAGAFGELADVAVLGTILAFTLIASAESLFSAAAVDRMHDGPRTEYDKELMAQGAGNTICGLLGALPMTAVIVRSAANVQAGARTKASRVAARRVAAALRGAAAGRPRHDPARLRWPASWCTRAASWCPFREFVPAVARAPRARR